MSAAVQARPLFVSAIAWAVFFLSLLMTFASVTIYVNIVVNPNFVLNFHRPIWVSPDVIPFSWQYGFSTIDYIASTICSTGMLKAKNWARYFFVFWGLLNAILNIISIIIDKIPFENIQVGIYVPPVAVLIMIFFLFRPKANEYFKRAIPGEKT